MISPPWKLLRIDRLSLMAKVIRLVLFIMPEDHQLIKIRLHGKKINCVRNNEKKRDDFIYLFNFVVKITVANIIPKALLTSQARVV